VAERVQVVSNQAKRGSLTRRAALASCTAAALFAPSIGRGQTQAETVIGVLNDQTGPFSRNGGPGSTIMAQVAVEEFGNTLFGRPIRIVSADHQNKPDIASSLAREWFGARGVNVILDGASSAAALAISEVARNAGKPFLSSGAATTELTGKLCSPMTIQFNYDTYMLANGAAKGLVRSGNDSWFLLVEDDAFGHALERDVRRFVTAAGGTVVGAVSQPLNTQDFASAILQAQSSKAKVVALCNAGVDFVNAVKQASEFGVTAAGQKLGSILVNTSEITELTLPVAQGLTSTESFYWDTDQGTRDLAKRFAAKVPGTVPTAVQAGVYAAVLHFLKAAKEAGTTDGPAVVAEMKAMPLNDAYNHDVAVRSDGRVMHDVAVFEVKSPAESKYPFDYYKTLMKLSGAEAYRPLDEGGCPMVRAR
jgi:branched-chain amino acid transport system substrate-binding protein